MTETDLITAVVSFVAGLLCSMGFGGGSVLIIFLTSFLNTSQKQAQGINLFFFIPCTLYSVFRYNRDKLIDKNIAKKFIGFGTVGVIIGYILLELLPSIADTGRLFGIFLTVTALRDLFIKENS